MLKFILAYGCNYFQRGESPMQMIATPHAPAAIGPYSQGIIANGVVYTSGQIPLDPESGGMVAGDIAAQTEQVLKNLSAVLKQAGADLSHIVKTTCFIRDMNDFSKFNEVYQSHITHAPARSCVEVSRLPKDALCEIEAIAIL